MSIICYGVLQYLLGGVRRVNGWPISLQQILGKLFSLLGCLLTVPHQKLQEPPHLPGELAMESKASKGVINST